MSSRTDRATQRNPVSKNQKKKKKKKRKKKTKKRKKKKRKKRKKRKKKKKKKRKKRGFQEFCACDLSIHISWNCTAKSGLSE